MTNLTPSSIQELAEQLAGPAHYQFDLLLEGLERERWRLGSRRYLTVSWRHEFDVDGLTDWVYLGKSFRSLDDAKRHAAQELADLKDAHLSKAHGSWVVDPETAVVPREHSKGTRLPHTIGRSIWIEDDEELLVSQAHVFARPNKMKIVLVAAAAVEGEKQGYRRVR